MSHPNRVAKPTPAKPLSRAERKALLLAELEQQRVDMLVDSDYLISAAEPIDRNLRSLKMPLYALGGVLTLGLLRRPSGTMAVGRKALAGYMLFRKLKLLTKVAT